MGFLDRLFEGEDEPRQPPASGAVPDGGGGAAPGRLTDEQAIARYRYLLQTAPPEAIEQAHEEAFARLSPEQRRMVLEQLGRDVPGYDRPADLSAKDDPRSLARMATRAELRRPGTMERLFGRGAGGLAGGGVGLGGMMGGSFLGSLAGMVVGSAVADALFGNAFDDRTLAADHDAHDADAAAHTGDHDDAVDATEADYADGGLGDDMADDLGSDFDGGFGGDFI